MIRLKSLIVRGLVLGAATALTACKIERTPPEFFDHRVSLEEEREAAAAEIVDRLGAFAQGVGRADLSEALVALSPDPGAYLIGPAEGEYLASGEEIAVALEQALATAESVVTIEDVQVQVGPRANVAWFTTVVQLEQTGEVERLRATGVYLRHEGSWRLVQAHLSVPAAVEAVSAAAVSADTTGS